MRILISALAGVVVATAVAAYAADDVMSNTYGNTITTKDMKTGSVTTLMFNQDGSYTGVAPGPDGKPVSYGGKWVLNGGNICLTPTGNPSSAPAANCSPVMKHAVGETWTVTTDKGMTYQVSLTAGH
ncbi:MAG TPA: hypothetical protein VHL34_06640 [Rhizomicrobium sp.]|jgi:hypothetical protein|nr:hypothetical protein [Rhizomicrobium sp.]